jgi:hypothetical protein
LGILIIVGAVLCLAPNGEEIVEVKEKPPVKKVAVKKPKIKKVAAPTNKVVKVTKRKGPPPGVEKDEKGVYRYPGFRAEPRPFQACAISQRVAARAFISRQLRRNAARSSFFDSGNPLNISILRAASSRESSADGSYFGDNRTPATLTTHLPLPISHLHYSVSATCT